MASWKDQLTRLDGFPLLPCGVESTGFKAPVDHKTGHPLSGWQSQAFTPSAIQAMNGHVRCAGTRTGPDAGGLLILDLDGQSAIDYCDIQDCDPDDVESWLIRRNTAKDRLKVAFVVPQELWHHFAWGHHQFTTKPAVKETIDGKTTTIKKAEQIELFFGVGQCIVLGEHVTSQGNYFWDGSPEDLAEPPPEWWQLILKLAPRPSDQSDDQWAAINNASLSAKSNSGFRSIRPCPICQRSHTAACSISDDLQIINCFKGQTCSPPDGLAIGKTITGHDGQTWAYCGDGNHWGEFSTFKVHEPLKKPEDEAITATPDQIKQALTLDDLLGPAEENKLRRPRVDILTKALSLVLPLKFNQLTQRIENDGKTIDGDFLGTLYLQLAEFHQLEVNKDRAADAALIVARRNAYHPVRDYFNSDLPQLNPLDWDEIAFKCFGVASPWSQEHLKRQLIGLVARAINPGCKLDTSLVIHSPQQGIGKSTMWKILGGEWFSDSLGDLRNLKDDILQLHSAWIHEWGEIDAVVGKRESETLKKFLSACRDDVRKPYGRGVETLHRSCGIVGTTNRDDFIKDPTGNRRFPVISVCRVHNDWVADNRDAIWGSALAAYKAHTAWHYTEAENEQISADARLYAAEDIVLDAVETWCDDHPNIDSVSVARVIFDINRTRLGDQEFSRQISKRLRQLGWEKSKERTRGELPNGDKYDKANHWRRPK